MYRAAPLPVLFPLILAACQPGGPGADNRSGSDGGGAPPNVIVVVVDDLRWDEYGAAGHPYLETPNIDRLAREGARFINAFHAVPLCSPNRASLLTGQYPSRHGIIDNVARNRASHHLATFPRTMQQRGYETAFVGKWHMGNDPTPRPGFDYWVGLPGQGRTVNPILHEGGRLHEVEGYVTDVLTDRALEFIQRERTGPFMLYLAHKAVHPDARQLDDGSVDLDYPRSYIPAPRHRGRYESVVFPRRPNVVSSPDELTGKPALRRALQYRASEDITREFAGILDPGTSEETIRRRAEMLLAVDEGLGRIMGALDERGILDSTVILFTSDNGFFYGEHGLSLERRLPYEESIRNPLLVRFPSVIVQNTVVAELALSIDIAPTILDLTGMPIGEHIQGRSLVPLFRGDDDGWRDAMLVEFYTYENPMPWLMDMDYRAVRTNRHKLIHWMQHPESEELYDLEEDPYEMRNLIAEPSTAGLREELRAELSRLVLDAMRLDGTN